MAKEWRGTEGGRTHPQGQAVSRGGWAPPSHRPVSCQIVTGVVGNALCALRSSSPASFVLGLEIRRFASSMAMTGALTAQVKKYIQAGKFENGDAAEWVATPGCWMIFEVTLHDALS